MHHLATDVLRRHENHVVAEPVFRLFVELRSIGPKEIHLPYLGLCLPIVEFDICRVAGFGTIGIEQVPRKMRCQIPRVRIGGAIAGPTSAPHLPEPWSSAGLR